MAVAIYLIYIVMGLLTGVVGWLAFNDQPKARHGRWKYRWPWVGFGFLCMASGASLFALGVMDLLAVVRDWF